MAMSKKVFVFSLLAICAIIIGAVVFVVVQTKGIGETPTDETEPKDQDELIFEQNNKKISPEKADMMCGSIINGTEPTLGTYNHPAMYHATLGVSGIAVRVVKDYDTSDTYQKNSYWLTGDSFSDRGAIASIRADACRGKVPVVVFNMRPQKGIKLSRKIQAWNHYKPKPNLESWEDYDKKLNNYLRLLSPVPAIVILEPDLLMFTFDTHNLQYGWLNDKYKEEFYQRAQRIIRVMSRSWVYVDAGNAAYLRVRENMEHMAKSLLRLDGLRGFSINTAHFFNASYNNMMARRLHCLTGLHYIADTSRNGGPFSRQDITGIEKCHFDPPRMLRGLPPGWSWGTKLSPRQKRWSPIEPETNRPHQQHQRQQQPSPSSDTIQMPSRVNPPNPQEDPEGYNKWINDMRNNGAHAQNFQYNPGNFGSTPHQPHPNTHQPPNHMNHNNHNPTNRMDDYNDLSMPTGRVPIRAITPAPTKSAIRQVTLRTKEEAVALYRMKSMRRGMCLRKEPVTVHDANVWIKTPGESDGRLYNWGTYHKCLLGHVKPCDEHCRLISHREQRSETCGCDETSERNSNNNQGSSQNSNQGEFFPGSDYQHQNSDTPGAFRNEGGIFFQNSNSNTNTPNNFGDSNQNNQNQNNSPSPSSSLADLLRQGR